jgi:tetratricopeptide (TPR) repeat protein
MASYREALKRWLRTHGREHRDVMQTYEEMANVSKAQKNHEDEKVYRRKSLDVALALYKETSEEVLERYDAMAACLTAGGRYENAAKIRRKILDIKTKTTSRNDAARAKAHAEYAIAQFHCAQYDSAYTNNLEALAIYERSGEPFRSSVAVVLSNLADTAKRMGAYDEAVRRYEASLKLVETHKIALDALPFLKNLPREIEACKKLKASCAVVKMTEVFRNQAADKAGALADDVWISIGPWHAKDALGKRRDRFWSSACESWESLTNTHRVLFLARKVDGKWKKIPCAFEKEHGGFRYGIDAMPKDEFGRMLEQTR